MQSVRNWPLGIDAILAVFCENVARTQKNNQVWLYFEWTHLQSVIHITFIIFKKTKAREEQAKKVGSQ